MTSDLFSYAWEPVAWEIEHERDVADDCDRFALVQTERIAEKRAQDDPWCVCRQSPCVCCEPISAREHEGMRRRYFNERAWQS